MPLVETETEIDATEDSASPTADVADVTEADDVNDVAAMPKSPRRISVTLRSVVVLVLIVVLGGTAGVLGWLYVGARGALDAQNREASNRQHAEDVATEYAVNAADMDYQDFGAWKVKLVNGTSPELKDKLGKAADSMEQVLAPLQWKSTAKPLAAKVRSNAGGVYTVDSFVSVLTKTLQAPEGLQSTATYSITIDGNDGWLITDVGGIESALGK